MEQIIAEIFKELGGATAISHGTGLPVQTVHDWLKKGKAEIPPWRRPQVLEFAERDGKLGRLSKAAKDYLRSHKRSVGKAAA